MPSPIAHGLAGLALAWLFRYPAPTPTGPHRNGRTRLVAITLVLLASIAADFDFIPGFFVGEPGRFHRGPTHSPAAAIVFGLVAVTFARWRGARSPRSLGLFMALVFGSHVLLDLLTLDYGEQIGLPLLWPLTSETTFLPFHVFTYISRERSVETFLTSQLNAHNGYAVLREIAVMGTVLVLVRMVGSGPARLWKRVATRLDGRNA